MNHAVFGKTMEILENISILKLSQEKEEKTICCQNKIIILQSFSRTLHNIMANIHQHKKI